MTDAEERFAERLAEDLERVLGIGIAIDDLSVSAEPEAAHLEASLLIGTRVERIEAEAADLLGLYEPVMRRAAELRLSAAFWQMVGPV
ncbi:MAG TPA: hypothetical protein VGO64_03045 [Candidatus Limnocylindrales bacterium]|nr:hypothetical protein [Candidatus Limnocylindrales bacterium]